jgi:hypothetical protein
MFVLSKDKIYTFKEQPFRVYKVVLVSLISVSLIVNIILLYTSLASPLQQQAMALTQITKSTFSTYTNHLSPHSGIMIQYPSDWNIEQTSNSSIIVRFHSPLNSVITIKISSLPSYSTLAKEATGAINLLSKAFTSFSPVDSGSSTTLAGNPAERLVFAARAGQVEIKELQVFTIKGGTEYILSYGSTKEVFSKDLPVAQKMIDSFQITR